MIARLVRCIYGTVNHVMSTICTKGGGQSYRNRIGRYLSCLQSKRLKSFRRAVRVLETLGITGVIEKIKTFFSFFFFRNEIIWVVRGNSSVPGNRRCGSGGQPLGARNNAYFPSIRTSRALCPVSLSRTHVFVVVIL